MNERLSECERIIEKIASIADKSSYWSKSYEDIADWHLAEVKRIIEPLNKLYLKEGTPIEVNRLITAVQSTIKRANGCE